MSSYKHYNQKQQILKRPTQHIGSTKLGSRYTWILETEYKDQKEIDSIVKHNVKYVPGLIHIFSEVLENSQDNFFRSEGSSTPLTKIEVDVDKKTGEISIRNDGKWIEAKIHEWDNDEEIIDNKDHYEAEIIFGYLNSSGNYDDIGEGKERKGGGLHGVGVKLTNLFSSYFIVDAFDPERNLKFSGKWEENMSEVTSCGVNKCEGEKGFTQVTYKADFDKFGVSGYTDDDISIMKKKCIDCAMITGKKIIFNGEKIIVKNLSSYINDYYTHDNKSMITFKHDNCEVVLCERLDNLVGFENISFVNGINTSVGGVHVDVWKKAMLAPLVDKINNKYGKESKFSYKEKTLEPYFTIFINARLNNPEFENQTKDILCAPSPKVKVTVGKINSVMKWENLITTIENTFQMQGMKELKKIDGKKSRVIDIENVDDANKAGTAKSSECVLFGTEGLSAQTFATTGISNIENGTDYYGSIPFRGKFINVRKMSTVRINNNEEIKNLNKTLGLRYGIDYLDDINFATLRYGKFVILTDADVDGDHIKSLLINYFQYTYPSLLARGFVGSLRTPIVKATINRKVIVFYYLKDFKEWTEKQTKPFKAKYYKGLGTSKDEEILEIFDNPRYVNYIVDENADNMIKMLFSDEKGKTDERKLWLEQYEPKLFTYKHINNEEQVDISDFIDNEVIEFSIYDNKRSIPSIIDGFKPGQRKSMHTGLKVFNSNNNTESKVAQFAPKVAEKTEYHHGEVSLQETIIKMAQTYVGSNNAGLFYPSGQFGTRLSGGKDHSASRYIYTKLSSITNYIFRKEDNTILDYLEEDGVKIEPTFFVPIIPMILVNGSSGIGTGYSSNIPSYNPLDFIKWIKQWLDNKCYIDEDVTSIPSDDFLIPWYNGFKGTTTFDSSSNRYCHSGIIKHIENNCYEITELPIGMWTNNYKKHLNVLKKGLTKNKKSGYDSMSVADLKRELTNRNIPKTGNKKTLIQKLKDNDKNGSNTNTKPNVDYSKMKVIELKDELKALGLERLNP